MHLQHRRTRSSPTLSLDELLQEESFERRAEAGDVDCPSCGDSGPHPTKAHASGYLCCTCRRCGRGFLVTAAA
jgi:hypothetical protein